MMKINWLGFYYLNMETHRVLYSPLQHPYTYESIEVVLRESVRNLIQREI